MGPSNPLSKISFTLCCKSYITWSVILIIVFPGFGRPIYYLQFEFQALRNIKTHYY